MAPVTIQSEILDISRSDMVDKAVLEQRLVGGREVLVGAVLGGGGHTTETLALVRSLPSKCVFFHGLFDTMTKHKVRDHDRVTLLRPRTLLTDSRVMSVVRTVVSFFLALGQLIRLRPKVIVSVGGGLALPVLLASRFLRIKTAFVESIARVTDLSMTGRLLLNRVDLFIVQWTQLAEAIPNTVYGGIRW